MMSGKHFTLSGLVLTAFLLGCEPAPEAPLLVAADSLGISILEVDHTRVASRLQVNPSPEWIVGAEGGDSPSLDLHRVVDVHLSDFGELWIAIAGSQEVLRVERASGAILRLGGSGDGPGEFRGIERVWGTGPGQVAGFDARRQRYVEFSQEGEILQEKSLLPIADTPEFPRLHRVSRGEGAESFYQVFPTGLSPTGSPGPYRGSGPLVRLGDPPDTLTWIPGTATFTGDGFSGLILFGATTIVAEGPDGVWVGDTEHPVFTLWTGRTEPARIIRWAQPEREPVTADRARQLWSRLETSLPAGERELVAHMRGIVPVADYTPAFGSLLVDPDGVLWVGPFIPPERQMLDEPWPAQEWLVVDPGGPSAWRAETPEGLRVMQVGKDFILGIHTDELGVESVRLHRVEMGGSDSRGEP